MTPPAAPVSILVVEDEPTIASAVAKRLTAEGYRVEIAHDGPGGVAANDRLRPDLVILDVMLPGFDGFEVCRRIQRARRVPVLMLTARDAEMDLLVGLGVGADDYVTKPFSPREVVARVAAILRRVGDPDTSVGRAGTSAVLVVDDLVVDPARRTVTVADEPVHLTATEFDLLVELTDHPGVVRTREMLLAAVWGARDGASARTVDSHVASLRRKVGGGRIRTVHGVGYALAEPGR